MQISVRCQAFTWETLVFATMHKVSTRAKRAILAALGLKLALYAPSSSHAASSLTVWDGSSRQRTLRIMLIAVFVLLPLVPRLHGLGLPGAARPGHDRPH